MMSIGWAELLLAGVLALLVCVLLLDVPGRRKHLRAESFARRTGLPAVTPELVRRVTRRRRFVVVGTLLGLAASPVVGYWLVPVYAGLALGAVADAVTRPGPPPGTPRVAHATTIRLRDYVPPWLLGAGIAAAGCMPLLALVRAVSPRTGEPPAGIHTLSGTAVGWLLLATAAGLAASLGLAQLVVRRRQPAGSPEELAVEDALRAQAVRDVLQVTAVVSFAVGWVLSLALVEPDVTGAARRIGGAFPYVMLVGIVVVRVVLEATGAPRRWTRLAPAA